MPTPCGPSQREMTRSPTLAASSGIGRPSRRGTPTPSTLSGLLAEPGTKQPSCPASPTEEPGRRCVAVAGCRSAGPSSRCRGRRRGGRQGGSAERTRYGLRRHRVPAVGRRSRVPPIAWPCLVAVGSDSGGRRGLATLCAACRAHRIARPNAFVSGGPANQMRRGARKKISGRSFPKPAPESRFRRVSGSRRPALGESRKGSP